MKKKIKPFDLPRKGSPEYHIGKDMGFDYDLFETLNDIMFGKLPGKEAHRRLNRVGASLE
jgi:hypothetical protein